MAESVSCGDAPDAEILRKRANTLVCRMVANNGTSVIFKLWDRPGPRGFLRRWSGTSPLARELRTLKYMSGLRSVSPIPLASLRTRSPRAQYTEAIAISDLGCCDCAAAYLKNLFMLGEAGPVVKFEDDIIMITEILLEGGFVDIDHRISNFVVPSQKCPVRIDYEHSVRVPWAAVVPQMLGRMVGTLIGSHVYLSQPETQRTDQFVQRLLQSVGPRLSNRVMCHAQSTIDLMLEGQREESGICTDFQIVI